MYWRWHGYCYVRGKVMIRTGTQRGHCDLPQFVIGFEWLENLAQLSQPIKSKTQVTRDITCAFSRA